MATMVLAASPAAIADFEIETLVRAVELSPSNIILPASTNGMVTYRPCAGECEAEYQRARLTDETRFRVGGRAVKKFDDFRVQFAALRSDPNSYALISVDTKTKTVTSINIAQ
jgi:hypothetical protein